MKKKKKTSGWGRVRALNLTVPLGSGRVGSDDLGYGPGSGYSLKPVQTSNIYIYIYIFFFFYNFFFIMLVYQLSLIRFILSNDCLGVCVCLTHFRVLCCNILSCQTLNKTKTDDVMIFGHVSLKVRL